MIPLHKGIEGVPVRAVVNIVARRFIYIHELSRIYITRIDSSTQHQYQCRAARTIYLEVSMVW